MSVYIPHTPTLYIGTSTDKTPHLLYIYIPQKLRPFSPFEGGGEKCRVKWKNRGCVGLFFLRPRPFLAGVCLRSSALPRFGAGCVFCLGLPGWGVVPGVLVCIRVPLACVVAVFCSLTFGLSCRRLCRVCRRLCRSSCIIWCPGSS